MLAAGEGSRMGSQMGSHMGTPKQLLDMGGKPMVRHVVDQAMRSACFPLVVVVGANPDAVRAALDGSGAAIVENPRWKQGMGTSIQAGLRILDARGVDGVILMLADQPLITATILNRLVELHEQSEQPIVTAEYADTVGVPVLFDRTYFPQLYALEPDKGCKGIILKYRSYTAALDCPEAGFDVDTPEDYSRVLAHLTEPASRST